MATHYDGHGRLNLTIFDPIDGSGPKGAQNSNGFHSLFFPGCYLLGAPIPLSEAGGGDDAQATLHLLRRAGMGKSTWLELFFNPEKSSGDLPLGELR